MEFTEDRIVEGVHVTNFVPSYYHPNGFEIYHNSIGPCLMLSVDSDGYVTDPDPFDLSDPRNDPSYWS